MLSLGSSYSGSELHTNLPTHQLHLLEASGISNHFGSHCSAELEQTLTYYAAACRQLKLLSHPLDPSFLEEAPLGIETHGKHPTSSESLGLRVSLLTWKVRCEVVKNEFAIGI